MMRLVIYKIIQVIFHKKTPDLSVGSEEQAVINLIRDESDYVAAGGSSGSATCAEEAGVIPFEELITNAR